MKAALERMMHEALKIKLILESIPQKLRNAKNVTCLLRKAAADGRERLAERESTCATTWKTKGSGLHKPFKESILPP